MVKSRLLTLICAAFILSILITAAHDLYAASVPAINVTVTEVFSGASLNYTFGYEFRADTNFEVTALGIYDNNGDGLPSSYNVGIWGPSTSLLGSVTVPTGTGVTLNQGYRYQDLSVSIPIISGQYYRVGTLVLSGQEYVRQATSITSSWLTVTTTNFYASGSPLARPISYGGSDIEYMTANMLVTPLPPALWLLGSGIIGLVGIRRKFKE